jgi:thiol-disulfide isomerase/thioredoxin
VGLELPELDLRGLTNASEMVALGDIRGQVVLLNFWATWCGPCLAELPEMAGLAARMKSENGFRLLSVVVAPAQSEGEFEDLRLQVQAVLDDLEIDSMTTYADPQGSTFDGFLDLSGRESVGVPTNVLVDRQGAIRAVWLGFRPGITEEMESYVRGLL